MIVPRQATPEDQSLGTFALNPAAYPGYVQSYQRYCMILEYLVHIALLPLLWSTQSMTVTPSLLSERCYTQVPRESTACIRYSLAYVVTSSALRCWSTRNLGTRPHRLNGHGSRPMDQFPFVRALSHVPSPFASADAFPVRPDCLHWSIALRAGTQRSQDLFHSFVSGSPCKGQVFAGGPEARTSPLCDLTAARETTAFAP